jgi:hypothetical protein
VVTRIHRALAAGLPPGAALARARSESEGGVEAAVAAAFLCIGADDCAGEP